VFPRLEKERQEAERRAQVLAAQRMVEQFYTKNCDLLGEHVPDELFRASLLSSIEETASAQAAWEAARRLLERLQAILQPARELRRAEEERREQAKIPDPRPAARALINEIVAELRLGLPPDVIARSLEGKLASPMPPPSRTLDQDDFRRP
jgi:hypothetical protein